MQIVESVIHGAKIMQMSAMKACFQIAECSFPSRSVGLPPLSPSRTVHATFTAHGSCNSVNYFSF